MRISPAILHCEPLSTDHTAPCQTKEKKWSWTAVLGWTIATVNFQVLCALTLPMGKTVVDYVLKHHEVNCSSLLPCVSLENGDAIFFALTRFETPCLSGQREDIHGEVLLRAPARAVWDGTGLWFGLGPKWYISLTDRLIGGAEIQERVQSTLEFQNQRAPCSSIYVLNLNYFWFDYRTGRWEWGAVLSSCSFAKKRWREWALGEVELLQRQNSDAHRPVSDGKFGARVHLVQRPCTLWSALGGLLARARSDCRCAGVRGMPVYVCIWIESQARTSHALMYKHYFCAQTTIQIIWDLTHTFFFCIWFSQRPVIACHCSVLFRHVCRGKLEY